MSHPLLNKRGHRIDPVPVSWGAGSTMSPSYFCGNCNRDLEREPRGYRHLDTTEGNDRLNKQIEASKAAKMERDAS